MSIEVVESIPPYIRVSAIIYDASAAIENVYTFALLSYDPQFFPSLVNFAEQNITDLTPMFDPEDGSTSKNFDNPSGISFSVIGYLGKVFSAQVETPAIIDVDPQSQSLHYVFAYSINSLGYKKITQL